ncbi:hypothetical protein ACIQNG_11240 [Streptomyces sp. NPDC091377]|uniref:hypothetical protein n=1 Tax=Streptomyces sp. NPDC091377 TaxID=3365995 RepID=UPI003805FB78
MTHTGRINPWPVATLGRWQLLAVATSGWWPPPVAHPGRYSSWPVASLGRGGSRSVATPGRGDPDGYSSWLLATPGLGGHRPVAGRVVVTTGRWPPPVARAGRSSPWPAASLGG